MEKVMDVQTMKTQESHRKWMKTPGGTQVQVDDNNEAKVVVVLYKVLKDQRSIYVLI